MTKYSRQSNLQLRRQKQGAAPRALTLNMLAANTKLVNTIMVATLGLLMIGYIVVMNSAAADTFQVFELTRAINETQQDNDDLTLAISEIQSLQHVKEQIATETSMVAVTDVEYVSADSAVALSQ